MKRGKLFIENFIIFGGINALTKVIPLIFLPIITRIIVNASDFGIFDVFLVTVNLGGTIIGLGLHDAMFREFFDIEDQNYKKLVTSTTLNIVFISSFIVSFIFFVLSKQISKLFYGCEEYNFLVYL